MEFPGKGSVRDFYLLDVFEVKNIIYLTLEFGASKGLLPVYDVFFTFKQVAFSSKI